jgi:acyl transferase domain-containing protein/NAD(P)H-dependent flavin oxidoreductase YrpB (nitropropane dioxygenase family)/NAD(P)-dependent dehydrogenase (short-subunit alcohol dehydrogenase family)/phosphopantetheinyl transferase (holo-ACP synthase)
LPPGQRDLSLLIEGRELAEPLLDLRYGDPSLRLPLVKEAVAHVPEGLTLWMDIREKELVETLAPILPSGARIIVSFMGLSSIGKDAARIPGLREILKEKDVAIGVEVAGRDEGRRASAGGADFLVVSGVEAAGPVSSKTTLILLQEVLEGMDIPLVVRGSLGPRGAAAAYAAGCAGCILDSQLLLLPESGLGEKLRASLASFSPSDTVLVGDVIGRPFRSLCIGNHEELQSLMEQEREIWFSEKPLDGKISAFETVLAPLRERGFRGTEGVFPVGQGLSFAQDFAEKGLDLQGILDLYFSTVREAVSDMQSSFPFQQDGPLARHHGVRYPIVQGPLGGITVDSKLPLAVARAGGLPFLAGGSLSPLEIGSMLREARQAMGSHPFGVGLIGFSQPDAFEAQLEALVTDPPNSVILAGGDPNQAKRFEAMGVHVYLHAPTLSHLGNFLENGVRGIVLEGHEAGGHVGALGSLILWELGVGEMLSREASEIAGVRLLLAGGIAGARGALAAATIASSLGKRGVALGMQLGTAYLLTDEAVSSGAIPASFQESLLRDRDTVVLGRTVNRPARWLDNRPAREMTLALSDSKTEGADGEGASCTYLCGQMIALQDRPRRMTDLHEELTEAAHHLGQECPLPKSSEEIPEGAIAVVGMGGIFPGAETVSQFWANILGKVDMVREVSPDRWDPDLYYDPRKEVPDKTYSKIGAFVEGFKKDPLKFRIPPVSAPYIDCLQFMTLEVVHQAFVDAGYLHPDGKPTGKDFPRKKTAVLIGNVEGGELRIPCFLRTYWPRFAKALESSPGFMALPEEEQRALLARAEETFKEGLPPFTEDTCPGVLSSLVAGRVSNCFNLGGAGIVFDAACASSLAAVDAAVTGLRERRFDLAIAGGSDGRMDAETYVLFSSLGALSSKGSFPFDERADGFVLGEGVGIVVLKRFEDALASGDRIYALIRGLGCSTDGRVKGITAPDVNGQILALSRTYEHLPFGPDTLGLIEAHATATWEGDIAEITSLNRFLRQYTDKRRSIGVGSVKSMIGHLKAAAGIAGLIKVVMALYHRVLPPTMHCEQPRKEVDWDESPLYLITEPKRWPEGETPRRAAVNAFGFGGVNYHAVLEEAPPLRTPAEERRTGGLPAEIFIFRSDIRSELLGQVNDFRAALAKEEDYNLHRAAIDLLERTGPGGQTLAVVATQRDQLQTHLDRAVELLQDPERQEFTLAQGIYFGGRPLGEGEKVAFLFPGQGSQYLNMGGDLPGHFPFVERIFQEVDSVARRYTEHAILPLLVNRSDLPEDERDRLKSLLPRPDVNHPAMLAMGMALLEVLARAGVGPDLVAGHSLGEYLALCAAGVFDTETALFVTMQRGRGITEHCFRNGAMASVSLSGSEVEKYLADAPGFVAIANKNCPAQTVISGEEQAILSVMEKLGRDGIQCVRLPVSCAFHTPLLQPCVEPFRQVLAHFDVHAPRVPVQSNLTGRSYEEGEGFSERLRETLARHLVQPVEFIRNVESMYQAGARLFVEVGPGSVLCSFVDNILGGRAHWCIPTNLPRRPASLQVMHALAFCASRGVSVDPRNLGAPGRRVLRPSSHRVRKGPVEVRSKESASVPPPSTGSWLDEALSGKDRDSVREYLTRRGGFLQDMVRLDFQHFTGRGEVAVPEEGRLLQKATDLPPAPEEGLHRMVVELVARKTGYPPEVIDIDFDVEAELGLDSIKQVEILRELTQALHIDLGKDTRSQRYKISTLRVLMDQLQQLLPATGKGSEAPLGLAIGPEEKTPSGRQGPRAGEAAHGEADGRRWVCEAVETPRSHPSDWKRLAGRRVLLLEPENGSGSHLTHLLQGVAGHLVSLKPPTGPDDLPEDFDVVVDMLSFREETPLRFENSARWWEETAYRARLLLEAARRLSAKAGKEPGPAVLWVEVTSLGGDLGTASAPPSGSRPGIGLGLSRCLITELEGRGEGLYLDFDEGLPPEEVARRVMDEVSHPGLEREIGYTEGKRFILRWSPGEAPDGPEIHRLTRESVVLAVGGGRGITARLCEELSRRGAGRFLILGRSPEPLPHGEETELAFGTARDKILGELREKGKPVIPAEVDRRAWERVWEQERRINLRNLRGTGAEVVYRQCDLTDPGDVEGLRREIRERYSRIDLVLHGGAMLVERSIPDFTPEGFVEGMRTKALGTALLLASLEGVPVGTFINLSSVAGRWGNRGQSAYAAGQEIAAALVASSRVRPGRWINVFYGPWLDRGMTRTGHAMERLREKGSQFVGEGAGSIFLGEEYERGPGSNVAFCGYEPTYATFLSRSFQKPPLLDDVKLLSPAHAEGRRLFDLKHDRFVAEHYIDDQYPILPGVVILEMIAQTASVLVPSSLEVTDLKDIVFMRPGRFPRGEPREFYSRAKIASMDQEGIWVEGEVFSLFTPPGSEKVEETVHARCSVRYGHRTEGPRPSLLLAAAGLGNLSVEASPLWEIHPRIGVYRSIRSYRSVTWDGMIAEVQSLPVPEFGDRPFLYSPIRLDGLISLNIHTGAFFYDTASDFFAGVQSVRFFTSSHDQPGAPRLGRLRISKIVNGDQVCDVEATDESGRVTERIVGLHKVVAKAKEEALLRMSVWEAMRDHPRERDIRRLLGAEKNFVLTQASISLTEAALEEDEEHLIGDYLSEMERDLFLKLSHPKRRREWLAGRVAAKAAIRILLQGAVSNTDISLVREESGGPSLQIKGQENRQVFVSLSHSGEVAVALASLRSGYGIDVQAITDSVLDLKGTFAADSELENFHKGGLTDPPTAMTILWSVKEACLKAVGPKRFGMRKILLESVGPQDGYVVCRLAGPEQVELCAVAFHEDGYAYAVASALSVGGSGTL